MKNKLKDFNHEILQQFDSGNTSVKELAQKYQVTESSIRTFLYKNGRKAIRLYVTNECSITITDAAYIAGIFDGEGCLYARKVTSRNTIGVQGGIIVNMTSKDLLDELCAITGIGTINPVPVGHANHEKWKPLWRWAIGQQAMIPLLEKVMPYMKLKKKRAELLLELAQIKRKSTTSSAYKIERQFEIVKQMQEMNKRGVEK